MNCDNKSNYQWRLTGRTPYSDLPGGFSIEFFKNKSTLYRYLNITSDGNVGIGVDDPVEKVEVNGNVLIKDNNALILTSPNGTQYKITVDDYGNLTTEAVVSTNSVDSLSSLETIVDADVEIYPNPTQSKISVNINKTDLSDVNVELYDIKGKLVFMQNFNSSQFDCNINNLSKGTYIVRIKDSNNKIIATSQIIKK